MWKNLKKMHDFGDLNRKNGMQQIRKFGFR